MVLRRAISFLVFVGLLAHAGAIVRHLVTMAEHLNQVASVALLVEQGVICHTDTDTSDSTVAAGVPGTPDLPKVQKSCPICEGLASLFALEPRLSTSVLMGRPTGVYEHPTDQRVAQLKRIRPQGRGPPSLA